MGARCKPTRARMHNSLIAIRALLVAATIIAVVILSYSIICDEACYTVPCLSKQDYTVNTLKVTVSTSVGGITYAFLYSVFPLYIVYSLYTKVRSFGCGFIVGSSSLLTLTAFNQAVSIAEQFIVIYRLSQNEDEISIYGSDYEINEELLHNMGVLSGLLILYFALAAVFSCMLFVYREDYTVSYSRVRQSDFLTYQQQSSALMPSISDM